MYHIILQPEAERFLKKLDKSVKPRIAFKLKELKSNPELGIPLTGNLSGLWKLRIGDYRAIYKIVHNQLIVLVLRLGHRKNIYD